jgi:hypothetical protein
MGPKIWNDLAGKIDRDTSLKIFKRSMIGLLIEKYG